MAKLKLGNGAQFTVYISAHNDTATVIPNWSVTFTQGNWTGTLTQKNGSGALLPTPNLSGIFQVKAVASGPNVPQVQLKPLPTSGTDIGCNSNCVSMVILVANEAGTGANYQCEWDIYCKPTKPA